MKPSLYRWLLVEQVLQNLRLVFREEFNQPPGTDGAESTAHITDIWNMLNFKETCPRKDTIAGI